MMKSSRQTVASKHVWLLTRAAGVFTTVLLMLTAGIVFSALCLYPSSDVLHAHLTEKGNGGRFISAADHAMFESRRVLDGGDGAAKSSPDGVFLSSARRALATAAVHLGRVARILQDGAPAEPSAPPSIGPPSVPSARPPASARSARPPASARSARPPASAKPPASAGHPASPGAAPSAPAYGNSSSSVESPPSSPVATASTPPPPPAPPAPTSIPPSTPTTTPPSTADSSLPLPESPSSSLSSPMTSLPPLATPTNGSSGEPNTTRPTDFNDFTTAPQPDYGNYTANPTDYGKPRNNTAAPSSTSPGPALPYYYDPVTGIALPVTWAPRSAPPSAPPAAPPFPDYAPNSSFSPPSLNNDDPDNVVPNNQTVYNQTWLNMTYPPLTLEGRPIITIPPSMFLPAEKPNVSSAGLPRTKHPLTYLKHTQQPNFIVALDGSGDFTEVQAAIDHVPWDSESRYVILVKPGQYFERIWIPKKKPFVSLVGWGREITSISFNLTADIITSKGDAIKTYFSPSVIVEGRGFIARGITFRNDAPRPPFGSLISQAVAIRVTADQAAFYDCTFVGWQDTLYAHKGRQYYENCEVYGSVDFIFGNAAALFENCSIFVRGTGWVTAQSRKFPENRTGFVFNGGSITRAVDGDVSIGSLLGRPWGYFSFVLFANTFMDYFILGEGWGRWLGREKHSIYGEFNTSGPGSVAGNGTFRVPFAWNFSEAEVRPILGEPGRRPGFDFIMADEWMEVPPNIPPPPPASDPMPSSLPNISMAEHSSVGLPWESSPGGGPPLASTQPVQPSSPWEVHESGPGGPPSGGSVLPVQPSAPLEAHELSSGGLPPYSTQTVQLSSPSEAYESSPGGPPPVPTLGSAQTIQPSSPLVANGLSSGGLPPYSPQTVQPSSPSEAYESSPGGPPPGATLGSALGSSQTIQPYSTQTVQPSSPSEAYESSPGGPPAVPIQTVQPSSPGGNQPLAVGSNPQSGPGSEAASGAGGGSGPSFAGQAVPSSSIGQSQGPAAYMTPAVSSDMMPGPGSPGGGQLTATEHRGRD